MYWLDRLTGSIAPTWTLRRMRSRMAGDLLRRHFEGAAASRRTEGWHRGTSDPNTAAQGGLAPLRNVARDLVRNNPYAASAVETIINDTVGWGIVGTAEKTVGTVADRNRTDAAWKRWAESTDCDADGRLDFVGIQKLVLRTVVESGEVLIRRRWRRPDDGYPIPLQLQVLEPDYPDTMKDGVGLGPEAVRGRIIQGIEFDPIGKRRAYHLFAEHPGSTMRGGGTMFSQSTPVPASEILHVFRPGRPGQVRGYSWFAPVMLKLKDWDDYEDAALMKQKVAACLAVLVTDIDGSSTGLGTASSETPGQDRLYPAMIQNMPVGKTVTVVEPPSVSEHGPFASTMLRAIATGLGVTYEALTGDYAGLPYSAARMSRLRAWACVDDWRWRMLIPQFCDPVWRWVMDAATIVRMVNPPTLPAHWTCQPAPLMDPQVEADAYKRLVRIGAMSWPEMVRERGYDPDKVLEETREWNEKFDEAGVIYDSDARWTTEAGQAQAPASMAVEPAPAMNGHGNGGQPY